MKVYGPDLSEDELKNGWDTVTADLTNTVEFDDGLDVSLTINSGKIEMMEINGNLK